MNRRTSKANSDALSVPRSSSESMMSSSPREIRVCLQDHVAVLLESDPFFFFFVYSQLPILIFGTKQDLTTETRYRKRSPIADEVGADEIFLVSAFFPLESISSSRTYRDSLICCHKIAFVGPDMIH
jgi:hypothetical protein